MSELKTYYQNLYRKRSVKTEEECLEYLSELNTPSLSLEERELCEGKLTLTECWNALQSMKDGKSPGNDGLTKEFYLDGILFASDIEKAFNSVDHNFIFASLKKFGFGDNFIQWTRTIFESSESCMMNNATSTG